MKHVEERFECWVPEGALPDLFWRASFPRGHRECGEYGRDSRDVHLTQTTAQSTTGRKSSVNDFEAL